MRFLEKFLDSLASNPIIKCSQIFQDFLQIENESNFISRKKEYSKIKPPSKLSEMRTLEGQQKLQISKEVEALSENGRNYTNLNEVILKKLSTSYKNLFLEMNSVSLRMKEISEIYGQLYAVSEKSNDV